MGNMMVINTNHDVKTAVTRDMKNLLTRVSNDLVCKIWVWRTYEGCFEMTILCFRPKSKWKKIEITLEKCSVFAPRKFFLTKFSIKKQEIVKQKIEIKKSYTVRAQQPVWPNFNPIAVSGQSSHVENGYQQKWTWLIDFNNFKQNYTTKTIYCKYLNWHTFQHILVKYYHGIAL